MEKQELINLESENVNATLNKSLKEDVIIVYTTNTCSACKTLKTTLNQMIERGEISNDDVYIFNMESEKNISYGVDLGIRSIPALIKYTKGMETTRMVGSKSPVDILNMLKTK